MRTIMKKQEQGIALVDLLVAVAFISILAAIFIPQMATFAVRTYNAAAVSDLRGAVAAEQTMYVDYGGYGISSTAMLPGTGGYGYGMELSGPLPAATASAMGGALAMGPTAGPPIKPIVGIGISVSSGVTLRADTAWNAGPLSGYGASHIVAAKHMMGDTAYAAEAEQKKSVYLCRNSSPTWAGILGLSMVTLPAVTTAPDLSIGPYYLVACGGMEIPNWTPLQ